MKECKKNIYIFIKKKKEPDIAEKKICFCPYRRKAIFLLFIFPPDG
jgi:hypothetical protein